MCNLGVWIFMLSIPTFAVAGWLLMMIFCYKGSVKERLNEWYHESDDDL